MRNNLVILLLLAAISVTGQELGRRVQWQATFERSFKDGPGVVIQSFEKDAPLDKAGLKVGDKLLEVDGRLITSGEVWTDVVFSTRPVPTLLRYKRGVNVEEKTVVMNLLPYENHPGMSTEYTSIISDYGIKQRVIITRPENASGKLPALVFIQGLSCSSIEAYPGRKGNWPRLIQDLVRKTGMTLVRIEKPGVGDSEGNCAETDFQTELRGYENMIEFTKSLPYVDTSRLIVYGSSMGSALAPYLAHKYNLAGVISDGVFVKTWFEHMLEIERRIQQMSGDEESLITQKMNKYYIPLYYGMLIEKKTFGEVVSQYPALEAYNYHSPEHMYGRPVEYYQQVQDFDFAGTWEEISVPVRINRGTNDWIMSDEDNDMIVEILERNGHPDFVLHRFEGLDHWNTIHDTPKDSFTGKEGKWDDNISGILIKWCQELAGLDQSN